MWTRQISQILGKLYKPVNVSLEDSPGEFSGEVYQKCDSVHVTIVMLQSQRKKIKYCITEMSSKSWWINYLSWNLSKFTFLMHSDTKQVLIAMPQCLIKHSIPINGLIPPFHMHTHIHTHIHTLTHTHMPHILFQCLNFKKHILTTEF